jgi:hypothetical protein
VERPQPKVRAIGGSTGLAAAAAHIPSHVTFAERCDSGITSPFGQSQSKSYQKFSHSSPRRSWLLEAVASKWQ